MPDPNASLRLIQKVEQRRAQTAPKLHGGKLPASGAKVRRSDGTITSEMSYAKAGRYVVKRGGEMVDAESGRPVSAEVAAKAAELPMNAPSAHGPDE